MSLTYTVTRLLPQVDLNNLMTAVNVSHCLSPSHKPLESPGVAVEQSPMERSRGFFPDESEPLLRCDSTSSKDSALSRTGSFITKGKRTHSSIKRHTASYKDTWSL